MEIYQGHTVKRIQLSEMCRQKKKEILLLNFSEFMRVFSVSENQI